MGPPMIDPTGIQLDVAEQQLDEHERRLKELADRARRLKPAFDEAERARARIERGLIADLEEIPTWQFWRIISAVLALKASKRYEAHFREVMQSLDKAEEELDKVHRDPRWYRISLWRNH